MFLLSPYSASIKSLAPSREYPRTKPVSTGSILLFAFDFFLPDCRLSVGKLQRARPAHDGVAAPFGDLRFTRPSLASPVASFQRAGRRTGSPTQTVFATIVMRDGEAAFSHDGHNGESLTQAEKPGADPFSCAVFVGHHEVTRLPYRCSFCARPSNPLLSPGTPRRMHLLSAVGLSLSAPSLILNGLSFSYAGFDKLVAARKPFGYSRRIPEATLLLFVLAGGLPGLLGGFKVFNHKTRKRSLHYKIAGALLFRCFVFSCLGL